MAGLLKRKYEQGHSVLWIKWDDLIDDVQATYGRGGRGNEGFSTEALISTAQNTPLLFLDDFGEPFRPKSNYRVNEDARSITWRVLSARHEQEWPTFITSNHGGLSDISDQFSPRIADRLMELCTVAHMEGQNLRHPSNQGQ
jgi:DNA replication protein DnaC